VRLAYIRRCTTVSGIGSVLVLAQQTWFFFTCGPGENLLNTRGGGIRLMQNKPFDDAQREELTNKLALLKSRLENAGQQF
jgi:hypothetical protein